SGELGPKVEKGDDQAPEGFYSVNANWMWPYSRFHLAFNIRFPNDYDKVWERTGSAIMVHGGCSSSGCFAMTDEKIEEIYTLAAAALVKGQPEFSVHVFPFHMTDKNMKRYKGARWSKFWANLKEGYDLFEKNSVPPAVTVVDKRYVFNDPTQIAKACQPPAGATECKNG
ncbi:MAG: L,D-transpeptidase family protein, partial [Nevskiales bacterium]